MTHEKQAEEFTFKIIKCVYEKNDYRIYKVVPLNETKRIKIGWNSIAIKGNIPKLKSEVAYGSSIKNYKYNINQHTINVEVENIYKKLIL